MKILNIKKLNQTGDTIIEVMIALAVLGLALGISYTSATKGLNQSQNAEEHSAALGIIEGQLEQMRSALTSQVASPPGSGFFCMTTPASSGGTPFLAFSSAVPDTALADSQGHYSEYPSPSPTSSCIVDSLYHISITPAAAASGTDYAYGYVTPTTSPENSYTFMIRWDGIGGLGPQQESLTYRIGTQNGGNYASAITITPSAPTLPSPLILDGSQGVGCGPYPPATYSCTNIPLTAVGSDQPFHVNFNTSFLASDPSGFSLTIKYSNLVSGFYSPPPSYKYALSLYINGNPTPIDVSLDDDPSSNTQVLTSNPIPLTGYTTIHNIEIIWTNDDFVAPSYDANFNLQQIIVQGS